MKNTIKIFTSIVISLLTLSSFSAMAEDRAFKSGDYWDVSEIEIMDGQWVNYTQHLAEGWRSSQEFAKSKGWIKDYKVLVNVHARDGEADLYLITVFDNWVSPDEEDKRYTI